MLNFIKKHSIVIFLVFLVVVLGLLKIFYGNTSENTVEITPTTIPTITQGNTTESNPVVIAKPTFNPELSVDVAGNYPLWKLVPYQANDFIVDGYIEPLILNVKVLNKDKSLSEIETEVKQWIKENGADPNTHQIIWNHVNDESGNY